MSVQRIMTQWYEFALNPAPGTAIKHGQMLGLHSRPGRTRGQLQQLTTFSNTVVG